MMGMVSKLEDPKRNNTLLRTFLRIRVALDIAEPLPTGFWLEREELSKVWIYIKYEQLQDCFCLKYGKLGHRSKVYKEEMTVAVWDL
ncbi:hypothetical protein AHAS_Ahas15G0246600 [Arachis hypogaea]